MKRALLAINAEICEHRTAINRHRAQLRRLLGRRGEMLRRNDDRLAASLANLIETELAAEDLTQQVDAQLDAQIELTEHHLGQLRDFRRRKLAAPAHPATSPAQAGIHFVPDAEPQAVHGCHEDQDVERFDGMH
jgi:hypothetical protein